MNTNLKNYATQPDPEVWERIERTMHRRALRKRMTAVAGVLAVIVASVLAITMLRTTASDEAPSVAQLTPVVPQTGVNTFDQAPQVAPQAAVVPSAEQLAAPHDEVAANRPARNRIAKSATTGSTEVPAPLPATVVPVLSTPQQTPVPLAPIANRQTENTVATTENTTTVAETVVPPATEASASQNVHPTVKATSSSPNDDTILWIPNIFAPSSPNTDINRFTVKMNQSCESITDYRIMIFTRSGQQVYISHDINEAWDGTFKGRELPQSAYVYVIQYTDSQKLKHQRKGTVTLIR